MGYQGYMFLCWCLQRQGNHIMYKGAWCVGSISKDLTNYIFQVFFWFLQASPRRAIVLSTFQQKSILSLLLESTRGLRFYAPRCEGPGSGIGQLYKYLQPLLKLILYLLEKYIWKHAHILAYKAMLSTSSFDRNKEEVGVWFSFLLVHNSTQVLLKERWEVHSPKNLASDMFGSLGSTVIAFLCDVVSTVGKNLYK